MTEKIVMSVCSVVFFICWMLVEPYPSPRAGLAIPAILALIIGLGAFLLDGVPDDDDEYWP